MLGLISMHIGTLKWLEVPNVTSSSNYLNEELRPVRGRHVRLVSTAPTTEASGFNTDMLPAINDSSEDVGRPHKTQGTSLKHG